MNRDSIFDNQRHLSLSGTMLLAAGIFIAAALPPLGVVMIVVAIFRLTGYRSKHKRARELATQETINKVLERRRRTRILALKAMP